MVLNCGWAKVFELPQRVRAGRAGDLQSCTGAAPNKAILANPASVWLETTGYNGQETLDTDTDAGQESSARLFRSSTVK